MERVAESAKQHEASPAMAGHGRAAAPAAVSLPPGLELQQLAGNQAMQQLLRSGFLQAKLAISNPNDPEEREADNVAHTIMRKAAGAPCSCSPGEDMCEECQQKQSAPAIQRRASSSSAPAHIPRIVSDVLRSPGHALDSATRAFFEPRFGRDFSDVRVHTDFQAADSARSIHAHAYTAGSDIVFAPGQYSPATDTGRSLLAHELTHVIHQTEQGFCPTLQRKPPDATPDQPFIPVDDPAIQPFLVLDPTTQQFSVGLRSRGIGGPLPPGTIREDKGLIVRQLSAQHTVIEYANSSIEFTADPGGAYSYFIDEAVEQPPKPQPFFEIVMPDDEPKRPVQRVVRFAANSFEKVHVSWPSNPEGGNPLLVLHTAYSSSSSLSTAPGWTGEIEEWWFRPNSVQLRVDSSVVQITSPSDNSSLRAEDYPGARFAYSFAPEWEGAVGFEKRVFIVASPGVQYLEAPASYGHALDYGRKLIPVLIRVPHPGLVPRQGTPIDPGDFVGVQNVVDTPSSILGIPQELTDVQQHRLLTVSRGLSGVTVSHPWSGSHVSFRPTDPSVGASFAWQVVPPTDESFGEIRAVVGPGTFIEFAEPVPSRFRRGGGPVLPPLAPEWRSGEGLEEERVELKIVQVPDNQFVPLPGTPINIDYYFSLGGTFREPDAHNWLGIDETYMKVSDFAIRLIPVVGELYSIGEFVHAIRYGESFTAQKVNSGEIVLMGVGIVVGLIPYAGAGFRAASRIAKAASALGKTAEELEATVVSVSRLASQEDQAVLSRGARAIETGAEIAEEDLPKLESALSHVAPGVSLRGGLGALERGTLSLAPELIETLDNPQFARQIVKEFKATGKVPPSLTDALERSGASSIEEQRAVAQQFLRDAARDPTLGIDAESVQGIVKGLPETWPDPAAVHAMQEAEAEGVVTTRRLPKEPSELQRFRPSDDKLPAGVRKDDELWTDYKNYFDKRLDALSKGEAGVKPPLSWENYSEFLSKFRRGTKYQEKVLTTLESEAATRFSQMEKPVVLSNVGVAGKAEGETTKFVDQLVVDEATVGAGKTPKIEVFSNKSRQFDELFQQGKVSEIRQQVVADATEAIDKYGGTIDIRRRFGADSPLKSLFNQDVKVEKVTLVYDKSLAANPRVVKLIEGAKSPGVEIIFL
jgi:hypothetical protein